VSFFRTWASRFLRAGNEPGARKRRELHDLAAQSPVLRVILGAGMTLHPGWLATDIDSLDLTRRKDWNAVFGSRRVDALVAEHVWEHLTLEGARSANRNCWRFLKPGRWLRLAVPDGFHPDPTYREHIRPGGTGPGAEDHKVLYNHVLMTDMLQRAGFEVRPLEFWDVEGKFHFVEWSSEDGHIVRSKRYDPRNHDGSLTYTSLIVDAIKPLIP
jgi:predicted SAM-dependent methyltransferase